jgi:hypothetical protein
LVIPAIFDASACACSVSKYSLDSTAKPSPSRFPDGRP